MVVRDGIARQLSGRVFMPSFSRTKSPQSNMAFLILADSLFRSSKDRQIASFAILPGRA
jgi:hypothetical protein